MAACKARFVTRMNHLWYNTIFTFSQHSFDTQSQSYVRMIGRCARHSTLLSDQSFLNQITANEPERIDHIDMVDLILYTHKIRSKHKQNSHLPSYHYFKNVFYKSVETLNNCNTLQQQIFNHAISIDTIERLLNSVDMHQNKHIFKCITRILSQNELLVGDFKLKSIKHTTYDPYIGSILRCNLALKLSDWDIELLDEGMIHDLENKYEEESNYKGSRIEKILIDYLHTEYKQNEIWIDAIDEIKRNVVLDNKVIECDIVIYLKDEKKKDVIVDVLGSHHYLTLSHRECGKTKFLQWVWNKMDYNVYKVNVTDFDKINISQIIKNVEKLLL
eukprot:343583_1